MASGYSQYVHEASAKYGVPVNLVNAVIRAESGGRANARSPVGALGMMQLMPGTARSLGVRNPLNPRENIMGGTKYLSQLLKSYKGDTRKAVAAYNAGPGNVNKYGGVPPFKETQGYVKRVFGYMGEPGMGPGSPARGGGGAVGISAPAAPDGRQLGLALLSQSSVYGKPASSLLSKLLADGAPSVADVSGGSRPAGGGPKQNIGNGYKGLISLGKQYGLNIQGEFQTTGGRHTPTSYHYKGRAVDFGDATNSPAKMRRLAAYARQHPEQFRELYYNPLGWGIKNGRVVQGLRIAGHDDHMHLAV